ncbi:MAG: TetR family transcriptional regulator [Alcanivorax sp.]|uniref:TetR/AcrR family transcriptional regulator n=1 Tax=unclassified Ketobacter TaxID=2639109 RepID=UPI000F0E7933|nr:MULTISPECIES: TetR/AcrR family transcriptional regulator [unclassified Ketobacter]MCK5791275.1 TetR/AcrR family transcriptional regulator [Ketobacter sp.]RLT91493.1 MAG: TetR/AcrR family transcriptional regulator [Ketobacter sp. GenoA1]RLT96227.1 MAG: TetR/AcrR family transcriptional regulator [Ketobacter sp.]TNC88541.1 MAG: TetR family transcriptional regulator [Alcanivorax sp.]
MARRNDHTREEIQGMAIDATRTLIAKEGLEGVSARKVAQKIGYTVGTLYQNFENIHELILHANAFSLTQLLVELEKVYQAEPRALPRIIRIANTYLDFGQRHEKQWTAIFRHTLPRDFIMPDWYQARIDALFSLIERAVRELAPGRDKKQIQLASRTLWSSVHGICILNIGNKLYSDNIATPQTLMQSLVTHYLSAWIQEGSKA